MSGTLHPSCALCRQLKIKCVRDDLLSTCERCEKTGTECINPAPGRRGRPPKSTGSSSTAAADRDAGASAASASRAPIPHISPLAPGSSVAGASASAGVGAAEHDSERMHPALSQGPASASTSLVQLPQPVPVSVSGPSSRPLAVTPGSNISSHPPAGSPVFFRLANFLDPEQSFETVVRERASQTPPNVPRGDDPVNLNILSVLEARRLVAQFYEHLNVSVAVLDPKLHHFDALRARSTPLFTSVICAAAKYSRPDIHAELLKHAQLLVERAIVAGLEDTALVQAILISVYYQPSTDTSAWKKIGWAIRLGYQFRWHEVRKRGLPVDEMAKREILDRERSWIREYTGIVDADLQALTFRESLASILANSSYSNLYDLPMTIKPHEVPEVEQWAAEHVELDLPIDMHLACAHDLRQHWRMFTSQGYHSGSREYNKMMIADMTSRAQALAAKWFNEEQPIPGFIQEIEIRSRCSFIEFRLAIRKFELRIEPSDAAVLDDCLSLAEDIVKQTEILNEAGGLRWLPDLPMTATTALALFIKEVYWRLSPRQQHLAEQILVRLQTAYTRASVGDPKLATATVARFVTRMLQSITAGETRGGGGGIGAGGGGPNEMGADVLPVLDEFAFPPDMQLAFRPFINPQEQTLATNDEQYWNDMLGGIFDQWQASSGPF